jgi:hypothetical protein
MGLVGACAGIWQETLSLRVYLSKTRLRLQDNSNNIDLQEFGCESFDGFEPAQNWDSWHEYANAVMNVLVP